MQNCYVVSFAEVRSLLSFVYKINTIEINGLTRACDLGVIFCADFTVNDQINEVINKATRSFRFLTRNSKEFEKIRTLKFLFFSFVRPHMKYASIIWFPYYEIHVLDLERVQNRFLRFAAFIYCPPLLSQIELSIPVKLTRYFSIFRVNFYRTNYSLLNKLTWEANSMSNEVDFFDTRINRFVNKLKKSIFPYITLRSYVELLKLCKLWLCIICL